MNREPWLRRAPMLSLLAGIGAVILEGIADDAPVASVDLLLAIAAIGALWLLGLLGDGRDNWVSHS
ncbi:MAG: hypothetical protein JO352_16165 [Chloroflexi bacterium]|nr:hypothetical protein [Chloroflexota bacterium]